MSLKVEPVGYRPSVARSVKRRQYRVAVEFVDLRLGHRFGEDRRVVGREGAEAEDFAVVDVHRDEGPGQAA